MLKPGETAESICPYKRFNRYCKAMFKDLVVMYPDSKIVKLVKASFTLLKNVSKKSAADFFYNNVIARHEQDIKAQRLFFLDPTFSVTGFENIGVNIKETWDFSDELTRKKYWDHWLNLYQLSLKTHPVR